MSYLGDASLDVQRCETQHEQPPIPVDVVPVVEPPVPELLAMETGIRLPQPTPAWDSADLPAWAREKNLVKAKSKLAVVPVGIAKTNDGRVFVVDERSKASLLADGNGRNNPIPLTYLHEEGDPRNSGYGVGVSCDSLYVYADEVFWAEAAAADLRSGARGPVSPEFRCEPLDPVTFEVLTPSSPLYVGRGKGYYGSSYETNTFRPMQWIVLASLVTVGALDLPPASLGAIKDPAPPAAATRKEKAMNPKLKKLLGIAENASAELCTQTLATTKARLGLAAEASEDDVLQKLESSMMPMQKCGGCGSEMSQSAQFCGTCGQKAGTIKPVVTPEELRSAAASAGREEAQRLWDETEKKKKVDEFDVQILAAEKDGRITGEKEGIEEERKYWRQKFSLDPSRAKRELDGLQKTGSEEWFRNSPITSGQRDQSLSVDHLPKKQADAELSRAAAWTTRSGKTFEQALQDVRGHNGEEEAFHRQVLNSNPDWMAERPTGRQGMPWINVMAPRSAGNLSTPVEFDPEKVAYIRQKMAKDSKTIEFLAEKLSNVKGLEDYENQKLSEAGNFQPNTVEIIRSYSQGFMQGTYAAEEISVPVFGGANREASYAAYSSEGLQAFVGQDGYTEDIGSETDNVPASKWNVDFIPVTLRGDAHEVEADRLDQRAGASLGIGVLARCAKQALAVLSNNREVNVSKLVRATANYNSSHQFPLTGARQWSDPASTPLSDNKYADVQLWRSVGQHTEARLFPPDVIAALSIHPDFTKFSQIADTGTGKPRGYAPMEYLVAVLGPILMPTARISTRRGGVGADTVWGQDAILYISNRGELEAPRAFTTVISSGFPIVKTFPVDRASIDGKDVVKASTMYSPNIVGLGNDFTTVTTPTLSAFIFTTACPALGHASL